MRFRGCITCRTLHDITLTKSRWTTPAECTYLSPLWDVESVSWWSYIRNIGYIDHYQNLIQKVLDKLLFQRTRSDQTMKVGSKQFRNKIANGIHVEMRIRRCWVVRSTNLHVFKGGDEDIAQADDLWDREFMRLLLLIIILLNIHPYWHLHFRASGPWGASVLGKFALTILVWRMVSWFSSQPRWLRWVDL